MRLLLATLGFGVVSSLFPIVNMEAYIVGVGAMIGNLNIWLVALMGGIGQAIGKVPWYELSRSSMQWSYFRKKLENPDWRKRYDKVYAQAHGRPWIAALLLFASSLLALPPLAITAVLAGQLRVSRPLFYLMIVTGRTLQFAALLGGASWVTHL